MQGQKTVFCSGAVHAEFLAASGDHGSYRVVKIRQSHHSAVVVVVRVLRFNLLDVLRTALGAL